MLHHLASCYQISVYQIPVLLIYPPVASTQVLQPTNSAIIVNPCERLDIRYTCHFMSSRHDQSGCVFSVRKCLSVFMHSAMWKHYTLDN